MIPRINAKAGQSNAGHLSHLHQLESFLPASALRVTMLVILLNILCAASSCSLLSLFHHLDDFG